jgi:hypothetical protein
MPADHLGDRVEVSWPSLADRAGWGEASDMLRRGQGRHAGRDLHPQGNGVFSLAELESPGSLGTELKNYHCHVEEHRP